MVECKVDPKSGSENTFQNFSKNLLKSFMLLIVVTLLVALKNKLITINDPFSISNFSKEKIRF